AKKKIVVNAFERSPKARQRCLEHYGPRCVVCGFASGDVYGEDAQGIIHVHHVKPLKEIGAEYNVDPVTDLRPVCPNCHAVIHSREPALGIDEVAKRIQPGEAVNG
ncbi:MAG: hypothetical protein HN341_14160, partial [Verrucomicrobia bacterium]|nr:hypothetical protein [Verrucomicrobiota bacterium]